MSKVDWSLAPDSATHYNTVNKMFYKFCCEHGFVYHGGSNPWNGASNKSEYGLLLIERPKKPQAWSGDGLPPVGTVCECHLPAPLTNKYGWVEGKVIWHHEGNECAVYSQSRLFWCDEFRAIKTPEQLAADQRESAIRELMDIAQVDCRVTAARLVDAGFKREVV
jgi:hypothetical protein